VTNDVRVEPKEFELIRARIGELYGAAALSEFEDHSSNRCEALSEAVLV
jgi:hypothetical protein